MTKKNNDNNDDVTMVALSQESPIIPYAEDDVSFAGASDSTPVRWGWDSDYYDKYPDFLENIASQNSTLQSVFNFTSTVASELSLGREVMVNSDDNMQDFITKIVDDLLTFGICFVQRIRRVNNTLASCYVLDAKRCRLNRTGTKAFYYAKGNKSKYATFNVDSRATETDIVILKMNNKLLYSKPLYSSAITSIMCLNEVNKYNLNAITNGFSADYIITLMGNLSKEAKDKVENDMVKKFNGAKNAGKSIFMFAKSQELKATIDTLPSENTTDKYLNVVKKSEMDIFVCMGITPSLLGNPAYSTGFSENEYQLAYSIYKNLKVKPLQRKISSFVDYLYKGEVDFKGLTFADLKISQNE